jgi:peptidoglycan/LPS O-acetylase OafA/YrhL
MKAEELKNPNRLYHLDALRGIAASSVLLHHALGIYPSCESWVLMMGRPAVTFFFLLSGYVLGKSVDKTNFSPLSEYICYCVRRISRLYPALFIALIVAAILARFYVIPNPSADLSGWFSKSIAKATTIHGLHDYLGSFRLYYLRLDPPLWTIQVEFVCSLYLPFLIWSVRRNQAMKWITLGLLGYIRFNHPAWFGLASYLFEFYLGYIAWTLSPQITEISSKISRNLILLIVFGTLAWMWRYDGSGVGLVSVSGMAAFLSLCGPCRWEALKSLLNTAPLQFLGRASYSLYLVHLPILMICWSLMVGKCGKVQGDFHQVMILLLTAVPISLILAELMERFVERPFNNWGHKISRVLKRVFSESAVKSN